MGTRSNGGEASAPDKKKFIVGAYAAAPPVSEFAGSSDETKFFEGLCRLPRVGGLELPFTGSLHPQGVERLASLLNENWKIAITPLPGQMQMMAQDPHFGLASEDSGGRRRAIEFFKVLADQMSELRRLRPDLEIIAVEAHSGPRRVRGETNVGASLECLTESVAELTRDERLRSLLAIEHCDSWSGERTLAKGFLSLADELQVAARFGAGLVINWGRSVLEGRSVQTAVEHVERARKLGVLRGLVFSGASTGHPLYGTWDDSHAPFRELLGNDPSLLLTESCARECLRAAGEGVFIGLKVQVLPRSLGVEERLRFLEAHMHALERVSSSSAQSLS